MVKLLFWRSPSIQKKEGCLPFKNKMISSSIFKNIVVVFHISSSSVKISVPTEDQLPMFPGIDFKCNHTRYGVGVVVVVMWFFYR